MCVKNINKHFFSIIPWKNDLQNIVQFVSESLSFREKKSMYIYNPTFIHTHTDIEMSKIYWNRTVSNKYDYEIFSLNKYLKYN